MKTITELVRIDITNYLKFGSETGSTSKYDNNRISKVIYLDTVVS